MSSPSVTSAKPRNAPPSLFTFNGSSNVGALTTALLDDTVEGAYSLSIIINSMDSTKGFCGVDRTGLAFFNGQTELAVAFNDLLAGTLSGATIDTTTQFDIKFSWPLSGAGELDLNGSLFSKNRGGNPNTTGFRIGALGGTVCNATIWNVKIFSDEAATMLIHHWPMNEGAGLTFNDIVGNATVTFASGIGNWG